LIDENFTSGKLSGRRFSFGPIFAPSIVEVWHTKGETGLLFDGIDVLSINAEKFPAIIEGTQNTMERSWLCVL
jgi:hypothetical protein